MKKTGVLNREISAVVGAMGHTDLLTVCDAGFPVPVQTRCIDLAVRENLPRFLDVLDALLTELAVEKVFVATETAVVSPPVWAAIEQRFPGVEIAMLPHVEFKQIARQARATIRTGEFTPYANIILQSGVVY